MFVGGPADARIVFLVFKLSEMLQRFEMHTFFGQSAQKLISYKRRSFAAASISSIFLLLIAVILTSNSVLSSVRLWIKFEFGFLPFFNVKRTLAVEFLNKNVQECFKATCGNRPQRFFCSWSKRMDKKHEKTLEQIHSFSKVIRIDSSSGEVKKIAAAGKFRCT